MAPAKTAAQRGAPSTHTHITTNPAAHVLQDGEAEVAQAVQLVLMGEHFKIAQRSDGRRQLLHMNGQWEAVTFFGGPCAALAKPTANDRQPSDCAYVLFQQQMTGNHPTVICFLLLWIPPSTMPCHAASTKTGAAVQAATDLEDAVGERVHQAMHSKRLSVVPRVLDKRRSADVEALQGIGTAGEGGTKVGWCGVPPPAQRRRRLPLGPLSAVLRAAPNAVAGSHVLGRETKRLGKKMNALQGGGRSQQAAALPPPDRPPPPCSCWGPWRTRLP